MFATAGMTRRKRAITRWLLRLRRRRTYYCRLLLLLLFLLLIFTVTLRPFFFFLDDPTAFFVTSGSAPTTRTRHDVVIDNDNGGGEILKEKSSTRTSHTLLVQTIQQKKEKEEEEKEDGIKTTRRDPEDHLYHECECQFFDGVLHIQGGDPMAASGTLFFLYVINHILYAERYNLLPWIHLNGGNKKNNRNCYQASVHGNETVSFRVKSLVHPTEIHSAFFKRKRIQNYSYPGPPEVPVPNNGRNSTTTITLLGNGIWSTYFYPLEEVTSSAAQKTLRLPSCSNNNGNNNTEIKRSRYGQPPCPSLPLVQLTTSQVFPGVHYYAPWAVRSWPYITLPPDLLPKVKNNDIKQPLLQEWFEPMRNNAARVVRQYFRPLPWLVRAVDEANPTTITKTRIAAAAAAQSLGGDGQQLDDDDDDDDDTEATTTTTTTATTCLALHIRHTDKSGRRRRLIELSEFLPYAQAFVQSACSKRNGGNGHQSLSSSSSSTSNNDTIIYLATDDAQVLEEIKSSWPIEIAERVRTQQGVHRSTGRVAVFNMLPSSSSFSQLGEGAGGEEGGKHVYTSEALVDIYAMGRCGFMVHGFSAMSEAAIYLNFPQLHNRSVNLEDPFHMTVEEFRDLVVREFSKNNHNDDKRCCHNSSSSSSSSSSSKLVENRSVIIRPPTNNINMPEKTTLTGATADITTEQQQQPPGLLARFNITANASSMTSDVAYLDHCNLTSLNATDFCMWSQPILLEISSQKYWFKKLFKEASEIPDIEQEWRLQLLEVYATGHGSCNFQKYRPTLTPEPGGTDLEAAAQKIRSIIATTTTTTSSSSMPPPPTTATINNSRGYNDTDNATNDDGSVNNSYARLAFVVIAHKDASHLDALIAAIHMPHHIIIVHLERRTSRTDPEFERSVHAIAAKYENVIILKFGSIIYETDLISHVNLKIARWLLEDVGVTYDYHINICGAVYPLYTAASMARILKKEASSRRPRVHLGFSKTHRRIGKARARSFALFRSGGFGEKGFILPDTFKRGGHGRLPSKNDRYGLRPDLLDFANSITTSGNQAIFDVEAMKALLNSTEAQEIMAHYRYSCCVGVEETSWAAAVNATGREDDIKEVVGGVWQSWPCGRSGQNSIVTMNNNTCYRIEDNKENSGGTGGAMGQRSVEGLGILAELRQAKQSGYFFARKFVTPDSVPLREWIKQNLH